MEMMPERSGLLFNFSLLDYSRKIEQVQLQCIMHGHQASDGGCHMDLVYVGLQKYSELSNALGGLSAALGGLSQLFFYAKTKLGYLRTKPGHCGLNQTFVD